VAGRRQRAVGGGRGPEPPGAPRDPLRGPGACATMTPVSGPLAGPHVFPATYRANGGRPMTTPTPGKGLEDVVVSTSEICFIDGDRGRLLYRGYDIHDLVAHASFEETAHLLWYGSLPSRAELERTRRALAT